MSANFIIAFFGFFVNKFAFVTRGFLEFQTDIEAEETSEFCTVENDALYVESRGVSRSAWVTDDGRILEDAVEGLWCAVEDGTGESS